MPLSGSFFVLLIYFGGTLGSQAEYRQFYQSGRSWKSKPEQMDFKDHEFCRFRPPGYQKFVDRKRKEAMAFPSYAKLGSRQESVKELIQKGRFLNAGYVSTESGARLKREGEPKNNSVSIMNEISSVEVLPIIRQSRTIECKRDMDGVINCHQDDMQYKIKLKHPDLPQDVLETLITNLYARIFKFTGAKKKRDGMKNSRRNVTEESPFLIVLPTDQEEAQSAKPIAKNHSYTSNPDELIIDCSPTDVGSLAEDNLKENGSTGYVYSCKWHGKRSAQQQKIIIDRARSGPHLQSFKLLIDPAKVGLNLLPITVMHDVKK